MYRHPLTTVCVTELVASPDESIRIGDYDIPGMKRSILEEGQLLEAVHARKSDKRVMKGVRRILAGQELYRDPATPAHVRKALESVKVFFYDITDEEMIPLVIS